MDLDVSEDERLPSGELVLGVKGTSLAVWTESPSLSLLRLASLEEEKGVSVAAEGTLLKDTCGPLPALCFLPQSNDSLYLSQTMGKHTVAEHRDSYLGACMVMMMQPLAHTTSLGTMELELCFCTN